MQEPQVTPEALEQNTADTTGADEAIKQPETTPSLEELLRQAELRAEEHHDAWLRAKAEGENIRRRGAEEADKARKFAIEKFAENLLPVKDTLEMALADQNPDSLRTGVEMTLKNLISAFEKSNLVEENPVGQKFDPNKHQAISMVEADQEPNTVVTVLQKGYLLGERTLRPAMVTVAKAK